MKHLFSALILILFTQLVLAQTYKVGDAVSIEWKGKWYPGKILEVKNSGYKISYDGYGEDWYETVTTARLKPAGSSANTTTNNTQPTNTTVNSSSFATISETSYKGVETIWDIDLGSDGKTLACANAYGRLTILNATDLTLIADIKIADNPASSACINKDCNLIAISDSEGKIYIYKKSSTGWDLDKTITNYSGAYNMRFSPVSDDLYIAGAPKEDYTKVTIDVYDIAANKVKLNFLKSTNGSHSVSCISLSKDGSKLAIAIANSKKGIEVYETATGKLAYRIEHKADVSTVAFSPDGNSLVSGGTDKMVTLWNTATKKAVWASAWNNDYVRGVAFAPNGTTVAACGSGTGPKIKVYDAANGKVKAELGTSNAGGNAICYAANSNVVYTALTTYGDIAKVPIVYMAAIPQ